MKWCMNCEGDKTRQSVHVPNKARLENPNGNCVSQTTNVCKIQKVRDSKLCRWVINLVERPTNAMWGMNRNGVQWKISNCSAWEFLKTRHSQFSNLLCSYRVFLESWSKPNNILYHSSWNAPLFSRSPRARSRNDRTDLIELTRCSSFFGSTLLVSSLPQQLMNILPERHFQGVNQTSTAFTWYLLYLKANTFWLDFWSSRWSLIQISSIRSSSWVARIWLTLWEWSCIE